MTKQETTLAFMEFIFWFIAFAAFKALLVVLAVVFGRVPLEGNVALLISKIFKRTLGDAIVVTLLNRLWQFIKMRFTTPR